jgi:hypothetical protein
MTAVVIVFGVNIYAGAAFVNGEEFEELFDVVAVEGGEAEMARLNSEEKWREG